MKEMRRVLALVLCLVMLIGIVPAAAFATESEAPAEESGYTDLGTKTAAEGNEQQDPLPEEIQQLVGAPADAPALAADGKTPIDAAILFSDLHTNSSNYKEGTVTGIMTALKNSDLPFSTVTSCGDAFSVNDDSGMYTGYTSTITGYIQGVFAGIPVNYVWSDHDRYAVQQDGKTLLDNDSGFIYGAGADGTYGTADDGNYYIFELSMADLSTNNRYEADFHSNSEVTANIAAFVADAAKLDKTKPLFIASHQPLLDNRNDNGHALEWCTAINEVAKNMDVAFFFGHNHKYDVAGDYYYAKGSTMSVCKDSAGNAQDVEINFTHMCAGYMEPTSTGSFSQSGTRRGVAVAAVIYEDSVKYVTYDSKGVYNGSYALNETVTRDHAAPAVTLTSIAVTTEPTTVEYTVGDTFSAEGLVVTGTYSDGTTAPVTGYTLSEVDMTTAGEKEVTVTYEGKTATFTITVAAPVVEEPEVPEVTEQTFYDNAESPWASMTATAESGSVTDIYDDTNEDVNVLFQDGYWYGFDFALVGQVADTTVTIQMLLDPDAFDAENIAVYYFNGESYVAVADYAVTVDEAGLEYITISNAALGTYVYGTPNADDVIPEGAVLESLTVAAPEKLDYFDSDAVYNEELQTYVIYLDITGLTVTGNYVLDGETYSEELSWNNFDANADGYSLTFEGLMPGSYGEKTVTVSYVEGEETKTETFTIKVWGDVFTADDVTVTLDTEGAEFGVTGMTAVDSTNPHVADAVKNVISGIYAAYDISLAYAEGYAATNDAKTVTLPIPEGVVNPVVYYVSDNGYNVIDMNATVNEDGTTVSFTTTHFSTYVVGEGTEIEVPAPDTATGSVGGKKPVYKLTTSISTGNDYLIVDTNSAGDANILARNGSSYSNTTATVVSDSNGTYIVLEDAIDELWTYDTVTSGSGYWSETYYTFKNGDYYLYYTGSGSSRSLALTTSTPSYSWEYSGNRLSIRSRYLTGGSSWRLSSTQSNVYFYVATEIDDAVSGTYSIDGADVTAAAVKDATVDLSANLLFNGDIKENVSATAKYEIVTKDINDNSVNGDPLDIISNIDGNVVTLSGKVGKALVKVTYESEFGTVTDYITVTATTPDRYSIQLHKVNLTIAENVTEDNFSERTYYTFDFTTGFYNVATAYVEGTTYYTLPVIQGDAITAPIALKGVKKDDSYSIWAVVKAHATSDDTEGVDVGTLGDALTWTVSDESIATINTETGVITFTGDNYGTFDVTVAFHGADGKTITSTITISATKSLYVVPGDGTNDFPEYPNEGAVRFDKTATAVGNYSETGIAMVELSMTGVPYSTGNRLDVVLMLDHSNSMTDDRMAATRAAVKVFVENIVINEDGTLNDNRIYIGSFAGGNPDYAGQSRHEFRINKITTAEQDGFQIINTQEELDKLIGTKKADGTRNNNGTIDTVFVKPTNPPYGTEYDQSLEKCYNILNASREDGNQQFCVFMSDGIPNVYRYGEGANDKTTSSSAMAAMFTPTTGTRYTNRGSDYKYEYWSSLMKQEGVTVFSVGLGLHGTNSSLNGASAAECERVSNMLLNDISGPAGETTAQRDTGNTVSKLNKYFFSVADDNAAADMKDVFSAISQKIVEAARDVRVEDKIGNNYSLNFSIPGYGTENAVSEDALDGLTEFYIQAVEYKLNADKERIGTPAVLENFTFNANGTFKSHTVDGVACSNCEHVKVTDGVITVIDGTYFDYTRKQEKDEDGNPVDAEYLNWEAEKLTNTELALQYFAYLDNSTGVDVENQVPAGTYYTNEWATLTYKNYKGNEVQREFPIPQMTWNGAQVSYVFYLVNDAGQPVNRAGRVVPFAEAVYVTAVHTTEVIWNDLEQAAGLEAEHLAENLVPDVYALYDDDASYKIHVYEDEDKVNLNNHFVISGDVTDSYNKTEHAWTNAKTTYVFNNKSDATKYNEDGAYIANDGKDSTNSNAYYCKSAAIEGATYITSVDEAGVTVYTVTNLGSGYQGVSGETQVQANVLPSTTGATIINGYAYYVDENGAVYTIVKKTDGTEVEKGFDFHNTTVAFAVVWKPALEPDTVVVDYGLDVVIDVIKNDSMAAGVVGVRDTVPAGVTTDGTYTRNEATTVTTVDVCIDSNNGSDSLTIGTAKVENLNQVRFSLNKDNGMQFSEPAVFYYEVDVNYYDTNNELKTTSMYSSVTVIPATTVYYEDEYVDLITYTKGYSEVGKVSAEYFDENVLYIKNGDTYVRAEDYAADTVYYSAYTPNAGWAHNSVAATQTQDVDRPGADKMGGGYDADNIYGSDSAYEKSSTFSLDNSAWTTVTADSYAAAEFEFYGTGFDVISVTSRETGSVVVRIYEPNGNGYKDTYYKSVLVDSYYGYTYKDGEWVPVASENDNALYQIPVIKIDDLPYNRYKAVIMSTYMPRFDHDNDGSYNFYLDAIRIYDPCGVDEVVDNKGTESKEDDIKVGDIYGADGEFAPKYEELRNKIIDAGTFAEFFEVANIKTFAENVTYFTKDANGNFYEVAENEQPEPGIVYYTVEANEVTEFAEGTTYFTKVETESYIQITSEEEYSAQKEYYTYAYEKAEISEFADGTTYYTKGEDNTYTEVPADAEVDDEVTYYTAKYKKADIKAFEAGVTYYTRDVNAEYIVTADEAPAEGVAYYTVNSTMQSISKFVEGVTYFTTAANGSFSVVGSNVNQPGEDVIYYTCTVSDITVEGIFYSTFVDGIGKTASIEEYTSFGPNNEVYLAPTQAIAAKMTVDSKNGYEPRVYLGIKSVGGEASVKVYGVDTNGVETVAVNEKLSTATDMYYDISNLIGKTIVIHNSGSKGIVSITNVKTAYEEVETKTRSGNEGGLTPNSVNAAAETEESMFTVDSETLKLALLSLCEPIKVEQPNAPEGGEPGGNEPGGEPEGGEPGGNEPGGEPEGGEPGGNEPGGEPEGGEPGGNEPGGEPEGGEPGGNEPGGEPEGGEPGGNEPGGEPEGGEPGGDAPQNPAPSEPVPEETEPEETESVEETIQDIVEIIRDIIGIIGGMFRGWF